MKHSLGRNNFKALFLISFFSSIFLFLFQNCSAYHEQSLLQANSSVNPDSLPMFEQTLKPELQYCSQCHGTSQQPMFAVSDSALSQQRLFEYSLVDLNDPPSSRIVQKIRGGHQNFGSSLADNLEAQIYAWKNLLDQGGIDQTTTTPVPTPDTTTGTIDPTFSSIHKLILVPKCVGCHSSSGSRSSEDYTSYQTTINTGKVTPGNANDSEMYTQCNFGMMPKNAQRLSNAELNAIQDWINDGALNN